MTSIPTRPIWFRQLFQKKSIEKLLKEIDPSKNSSLRRTLRTRDLTLFGVAALVGAGIFSTIGNAAAQGGPAVVFLFLFTAIACAFSAFCYAEFASVIPLAGSSYSYAYASFGELMAWIMGWDLLLEYAISNSVVAISWSRYFCSLLSSYGLHLPSFLTLDYSSAFKGYQRVEQVLASGAPDSLQNLPPSFVHAHAAWLAAPQWLGHTLIFDLPAVVITLLVTWVVFLGIQESKKASQWLVLFKMGVIFLVIVIGAFHIEPSHWIPFAPHGVGGIFKGVAAVFYAYIGFDTLASTAEECENPQRDLPRGMIYSLILCALIYSLVALVLTGLVPFQKLGVGDPLALVFGPAGIQIPWMARLVEISAVVALSTVLLVYQLGQPRIWMAMSRDGLLPPLFAAIHPVRKTPWFSTLLTGLIVVIPTFFMNQEEVTDLASMGTLFAFLFVCGGILKLNPYGKKNALSPGNFVIPYLNSRYSYPLCIFGLTLLGLATDRTAFFHFLFPHGTGPLISFTECIPSLFFILEVFALILLSVMKAYSLIPILGLTCCGYLLSQLGFQNWVKFFIWIALGVLIYFCYGIWHSKERPATALKETSKP